MESTVSPLEIFWTVVAGIGLIYSGSNYIQSTLDWIALQKAGANGTARIMASMAKRSDFSRVVTFIFFVVMGAISMGLTNAPGSYSFPRVTIALLLIAVELRIVWTSYADKRDRQRLLSYNAESMNQNRRKGDDA